MENHPPLLPFGYAAVPPGKIATVVTCLEMLAPPAINNAAAGQTNDLKIEHWPSPANADYRRLFRAVGEQWLWVSRLVMADSELSAILQNPAVEVYVLKDNDRTIGLLELDFRSEGECELAFFGLVSDAIGKGAGRLMMNHAIRTTWSRPIRRFWVHTCHLDSQPALAFYQRSGFTPYASLVEVLDDPRLNGVLPRDAAPHVPLICG
jgi:GNAT superfamily N-acetyltransferase